MSDEKPEQRDDVLPPDEIARRLSAKWRAQADERVRQRLAALQQHEEPLPAELERRLEQERTMLLDVIGEALLAEVRKSSAEYLTSEIAAVWRALAAVQGSIARIHQARIEELSGVSPPTDAKRIN
jgi:hypothetical protein